MNLLMYILSHEPKKANEKNIFEDFENRMKREIKHYPKKKGKSKNEKKEKN